MRHVANGQVPRNGFSCFGELTPLPSPLPLPSPPPSPRPSQIVSFGRDTHTPISHPPTRRAGEGHWGRQPNGSSCLDALALLPYSLAPPSPCYLFIPSLGLNSDDD